MRFLKSTLFPNILDRDKSIDKTEDACLESLKRRITTLEEENKKACEAVQEISSYLSQVTLIVTTLATEVSVLTSHIENSAKDDEVDKLLKSYFASDDDGYIH
tara:strand:- start:370 stop:678 length:309 start_codon:yes stop_codon:yes gene_type:complete